MVRWTQVGTDRARVLLGSTAEQVRGRAAEEVQVRTLKLVPLKVHGVSASRLEHAETLRRALADLSQMSEFRLGRTSCRASPSEYARANR